ncbi:MAG: nitrite/sulfite reductase [Candidatus Omnitrophica bacterium]|nr:nitrite/sulfite reductase [Candidatus Omnitrophota bacterium]
MADELTQVEKDKRVIGFEADFRDIARRDPATIAPNERAMFKWSGVYGQRQEGFFMIRLKVPGGLITAIQLTRAAELAAAYGRDQLCLTTRQCLQLHWVKQEDIYKVLEGLHEVGVTTRNACGDVTRNVVTCALAGVCPHEEGDTLRILQSIADDAELNNEQRNLPRKNKISVAGCGRACGQTLINCQGWHPANKDGRRFWKYYAGGGLGAKPYMAKLIFEQVPEALVLDVTRATTELFRRRGNRQSRALARIKVLVDAMGARGFAEAVLEILKERKIGGIEAIVVATEGPDIQESFLKGQPVIPQKQAGLNVVRVRMARRDWTSDEARRFSHWAACYGDGRLVFTNRHGVLFRNVSDVKVPGLLEVLAQAGYSTEGLEHVPDMVSCVGTTLCNLAQTNAPAMYQALMKELTADPVWWQSLGPIRINMNGCPNSCAQHAIADIGLRGFRKRIGDVVEEGYSIYTGGSLAGAGRVAEHVADVMAPDVPAAVRKLLLKGTHYFCSDRSGCSGSRGSSCGGGDSSPTSTEPL